MGLTKLLPDYIVETTFKKIDDNRTQMKIAHFYSSSKLKVWLLNFIIKRKVARETIDTLNAIKKSIEMKIKSFIKDTNKVSKIATIIIFLALIRCICEPFRLQYYSSSILTYTDIKPFLIGSLVATLGLFAMTILFYFGRHKIIIATCVLTIIILLIVKKIYFIP
jgi:hypothetical protein